MSVRKSLVVLTLLTFIGSFITFYAHNLLMSDVSNAFYGIQDALIISSLPLFFVTLDFVIITMQIIRTYSFKDNTKSMQIRHIISFIAFSGLGIISSILSGTIIYDSILSPYPFSGYLLICLIYHILVLGLSIFLLIKFKKNGYFESLKNKPKNFRRFFVTTVSYLLIYFAFNRFGALLWSPIYIQWRTFYMTFPFYLSLLLPLLLIVYVSLFAFDSYRYSKNRSVIFVSIIMGLDLILGIVIFILGRNNTQFVASISTALPIERLATMPIATIFQFVIVLLFGIYELLIALRMRKKAIESKNE